MAADWYYVANQQQAGPVELQALRELLKAGSLTSGDMVFGPGLTEWTRAGQVPALLETDGAGVPMATHVDPLAAGRAGVLGYRGEETGNSGLSHRAMELLRQTKPWARFVAVMMFIGAGFMLLGGVVMMIGGAVMGARAGAAMPAGLGLVYIAMGALYLAPAIFLNRFANGLADLLRMKRMSSLEQAFGAQKSFWKFTGIMLIIILCIYFVAIVVMIALKA